MPRRVTPATKPAQKGSTRCYPDKHRVTKAGFIGNESPAFLVHNTPNEILKPLINKDSQKLARVLLYLWHNNNKNQKNHNKNKTERLQHNKNNKAEAQLTDHFGEDLPLGFAPQPD